jgi:peptidoglycan/LPS O-acetylase OafA/YrhL
VSFTADFASRVTPARRQHALDGLRGWAALAVTFYHGILHFDLSLIDRVLYQPTLQVGWADLPVKALLIVFNGESAVLIFFILSGLVLRGALERMADQPMAVAAALFTLRRLTRIYPAVVACMLLLFAISIACATARIATFPHFQPMQLLQNITLYFPAMHGPSWSVQVEICAIPFLLAAEVLRRRWGATGLIAALIYGMVAIEYPMLVFWLPALWPYMFAFFLGMLLGEPAATDAARRLHPATWVVALVLFLVFRHITARAAISGLIAQVMAGGLLVACVASHEDALAVFLRGPVSQFLGRISYSFYLLNVVALYSVWAVIEAWVASPARHAVAWGLLSAAVSALLTVPVAALSERFVERPGIVLGRILTRWRSPLGGALVPHPAGETEVEPLL